MFCETPMVHHIRRFVHGSGCVQIVLKELDSPVPGYQHTILNYSWCRICKQVSEERNHAAENATINDVIPLDLSSPLLSKVTPVVPLSNDSWSMSFSKYLELRFYGHHYTRRANAEPCGHSMHKDYHQYFSYNQMVASFRSVYSLSKKNATVKSKSHKAKMKEITQCFWLVLQLHFSEALRDLSTSPEALHQEPGTFQSQPAAGPEGLLSKVQRYIFFIYT